MAIPDFEKLMLPMLEVLKDGNEYKMKEVIEILAKKFQISEEERMLLTPSKANYLFDIRVGWARTYLKKAGLVSDPKRGSVRITERGLEILNQNLKEITKEYLMKFHEFQEFVNFNKEKTNNLQDVYEENQTDLTPEEELEKAYKKLKDVLISDIFRKIFEYKSV